MEIVSTMGTGSIGRELNLETFAEEFTNHMNEVPEVNFHRNTMITLRLEDGGPAYSLYRTGSFQIRGARTEGSLEQAVNDFRELLNEMSVKIHDFEFKHVTSVFMEELDRQINLETLTIILGLENTEYEPEQFPGLIYRPSEFDVTLLIFASGKIIIGGTTEQSQAEAAVQRLQEQLIDAENL